MARLSIASCVLLESLGELFLVFRAPIDTHTLWPPNPKLVETDGGPVARGRHWDVVQVAGRVGSS